MLCRVDVDQWSNLITSLLQQSRETCMWMVEFLATDGNSCIKYICYIVSPFDHVYSLDVGLFIVVH